MKGLETRRLFGSALLALALAGCQGKAADGDADKKEGKAAAGAEAAIPVEVAAAARQKILASYTGTATLEADREAQVVAKTSGVLLKLHVEEGDRVAQGQLLAVLDPDRTELEVAKAESDLRRLESDYKRSTELSAKQLVSPEAHERIKFDLETQRAAFELAKLEHSYTRIVAPIDGVISERLVKEGNLIQLHQALFRIDDFDPLLGVLNVPERELMTLKPGLPVTMGVDALPGASFEGTVARVSPVVDPGTGTFRVTTEFRDDGAKDGPKLKSGMFGRLNIVYDERDEALVIPRDALIDEDGETAVFVVNRTPPPPKPDDPKAGGKGAKDAKDAKAGAKAEAVTQPEDPPKDIAWAHRRTVAVGYASGNTIEIRDGLAEGDKVITVGRNAVREGTRVQLIEAEPAAAAPAGGTP